MRRKEGVTGAGQSVSGQQGLNVSWHNFFIMFNTVNSELLHSKETMCFIFANASVHSLFTDACHGCEDAAVLPFLQTQQRALQEQAVPPGGR